MDKKKIRRIVIEAVSAAVLIFLLVFFVGFKVTRVQVVGNKFYTDMEIRKMVLDVPIAQNSILATLIKPEEKTKDARLIENVTISRKNRNTLVLRVKEKQMIGYVELDGKYVHFDRQGVIQLITDKPVENVPFIEGLNIKKIKVGEKLKGVNTKKLNTILSVGKMLEKMEEKPDRLLFNDMKQLVLYYGDIEVRLGNDENMDEKMNRLEGILPELVGLQGILHLENITENTEMVVFDNIDEEEMEDEPDEDMDEGDESPDADSDSDADSDEDLDADDDDDDDISEDDTDVEYSDGSDAADGKKKNKRPRQ